MEECSSSRRSSRERKRPVRFSESQTVAQPNSQKSRQQQTANKKRPGQPRRRTTKRKRETQKERDAGMEGFYRHTEQGSEWIVEGIRSRRVVEGEVQYLVEWKGEYDSSWQPVNHLDPVSRREAWDKYPQDVPKADDTDERTKEEKVGVGRSRFAANKTADIDCTDEEDENSDSAGGSCIAHDIELQDHYASGVEAPVDRDKIRESALVQTVEDHSDFLSEEMGPCDSSNEGHGNQAAYKNPVRIDVTSDVCPPEPCEQIGRNAANLAASVQESDGQQGSRSPSPLVNCGDFETETLDGDEEDDDDLLQELRKSKHWEVGGVAEFETANKTFRIGMNFQIEKDSLVTIRDLIGRDETALCEIFIRNSDTFLCDTKAEEPQFFPCGEIVKIPFSKLKTQWKTQSDDEFPKAKWRFAPGEIAKYDFAFFKRAKGRIVPPSKPGKPTVLELFAGTGGMTLGFKNAGFEIKWAVEKDESAASTLKANFDTHSVRAECVKSFMRRCKEGCDAYPKKGDVDHIHASPPCQGFSRANRYGGVNDDENNSLSFEFVEAVRHFEPRTATYENVKGLLMPQNVGTLKSIVADLFLLGYQVRLALLNSSDYGDPQKRERVVLWIAQTRMHLPMKPEPTHGKHLRKRRTVRDAIGYFEKIEPYIGERGSLSVDLVDIHDHCVRASKPTEEELDRLTLKPDIPALTIKGANHAVHYNRERFISVREAACLQSFPFDHQFSGKITEQFRQIGNAVPVMMATQIARSVAQVYSLP
eukprot:scaffold1041_cov121-Cylindrotheca_fusiformis.AAC.3